MTKVPHILVATKLGISQLVTIKLNLPQHTVSLLALHRIRDWCCQKKNPGTIFVKILSLRLKKRICNAKVRKEVVK